MRPAWQQAPALAAAALSLLVGQEGAAAQVRPTWNVQEAVEVRLAGSRALAGARLKVEAGGERVKLTGEVRDAAQRDRAVRLATQTPGVRLVEHELTVDGATPLPEHRPDGDVARDVAQRLAAQSPVRARAEPSWASGWRVEGDGWALAVDVDDGDVLLEGDVLLQAHLYQFVLAARGVPGVQSVRADATLRPNPAPEDPYHPL